MLRPKTRIEISPRNSTLEPAEETFRSSPPRQPAAASTSMGARHFTTTFFAFGSLMRATLAVLLMAFACQKPGYSEVTVTEFPRADKPAESQAATSDASKSAAKVPAPNPSGTSAVDYLR